MNFNPSRIEAILGAMAEAMGRIADAFETKVQYEVYGTARKEPVVKKPVVAICDPVDEMPPEPRLVKVEPEEVPAKPYADEDANVEVIAGVSKAVISHALNTNERSVLKKIGFKLAEAGLIKDVTDKTPTKRLVRLLEEFLETSIEVTAGVDEDTAEGIVDVIEDVVEDVVDVVEDAADTVVNATADFLNKAGITKKTPPKKKAAFDEAAHGDFTRALAEYVAQAVANGVDKDEAKRVVNGIVNSYSYEGRGTMGVDPENYEAILVEVSAKLAPEEDDLAQALEDLKTAAMAEYEDSILQYIDDRIKEDGLTLANLQHITDDLEL